MKSIIRNFIAKLVAGRSDDGIMITLKDPKKVDFQTAMMEDLLMRNGIDPSAIKSEAQLKGLLNQIEAFEKKNLADNIRSGVRNTESAKIFEIDTGKEIPKGSKIMGGKAIDDDLPPPGSRGGPDDIAAPVMNVEDAPPGFIDFVRKTDPEGADKLQKVEDEIKAAIEAGNKRAAENLRKKKKKKDDDPEKKAEGGIMRLGLKEGSGMTRRTFLKFLAGAASIPIVGKILKPFKIGKTVTKVPIIKTDNVPGKPEWFDQLVNKVILEGDDVSKRFATKDREIVHMKVLDEGTGGKEFPPGTPGSDDISIMVTQDLDAGAVRVEYRNPENMYGDPVQMQYKKPNPDEGDPRPSAEFDTAESIPVARADGPDDYAIDIDEGGGQSIKDLTSDVSKLKEYATGQKQTLKEFVQSKKRKDKARAISQGEGEAESDFIINRQGEEIVEYPEPDFDDAFASGGIARMLGE
jgi:hypothetical protein